MAKAWVNPFTQRQLQALATAQPHAVVLSGPVGVGLATIAHEYASHTKAVVHTVLPEKDEKIDLQKGTITIGQVRRLYDLTATRQPNGRVIIIDYAERMAPPAQNALLKLLEEPVPGTQFLLLTHALGLLLPTIMSRSQQIAVRPVSPAQTEDILDELGIQDATKRTQLLFIASGLPAELHRLVSDVAYFDARVSIVKDARRFITGSAYERLKLAKQYKDDRSAAEQLLSDALKQLRQTAAQQGTANTVHIMTRLQDVHRRIHEQGNVRLQLSSVVVL